MDFNSLFENQNCDKNRGVYILDKDDNYVSNFGKQWADFKYVQIDSFNHNKISERFLKRILFNEINFLKGKKVLEIGCGAGRFTEYIVKYAEICVSVDLSSAIFVNVAKDSPNLMLIKADFENLVANNKFDIVICRGVLQHTPFPFRSIEKLHTFVNDKGKVYFDIYKKPKIGILHPKYLIWRPLTKLFLSYNKTKIFLEKNIKNILFFKRLIKKIFFNSKFISDSIVPVWDYKNIIDLNEEQLEKWAILDTLDGLFAKYDYPQSYKKILKFINGKNYKLLNSCEKNNIFETKN